MLPAFLFIDFAETLPVENFDSSQWHNLVAVW